MLKKTLACLLTVAVMMLPLTVGGCKGDDDIQIERHESVNTEETIKQEMKVE